LSVKREGIETKAITQISELCNVSWERNYCLGWVDAPAFSVFPWSQADYARKCASSVYRQQSFATTVPSHLTWQRILGCWHIQCERTRPDAHRCALITQSSAKDTARRGPAVFGIGVILTRRKFGLLWVSFVM
jgi:hypothetical protein